MTSSTPDPTSASKFMSLVLRHNPAAGGLTLDAEGWTPVEDLLRALKSRRHGLSHEDLKRLVSADKKGRYAFSADGSRIRANQGHSVTVDLGLTPVEPPDMLFHGTVSRSLAAIRAEGLKPMERHHVHLSGDRQTASVVGSRRGIPVILSVDAKGMRVAGHVFYRSANGVWLTDAVPTEFLSVR